MIPKQCRRLAEIDFALSAVNDACVRENNIKTRVDSGHISLTVGGHVARWRRAVRFC